MAGGVVDACHDGLYEVEGLPSSGVTLEERVRAAARLIGQLREVQAGIKEPVVEADATADEGWEERQRAATERFWALQPGDGVRFLGDPDEIVYANGRPWPVKAATCVAGCRAVVLYVRQTALMVKVRLEEGTDVWTEPLNIIEEVGTRQSAVGTEDGKREEG